MSEIVLSKDQAVHGKGLAKSYSKSSWLSWLVTVDHKRIGILYFWSAFVFLLIGGLEALLIRTQLFLPENTFLVGKSFNQMFTMHGTTMVFLAVMPLNAAFFNYIIPLQIGARDVAFPRLNAFTFWIFLFGGLFMHFSYIIGHVPDTAWTGYANLTSKAYLPSLGGDFWTMGIQVLGLSTLVASFNFVVTILNMRAPGMTLMRMPLFTWTSLVTQVLIILSFPVVSVALAMLLLDRVFQTNFFNPAFGGDVLMWQHLFWVFGHPEVYILALPVMGYVSEILATFSKKSLFGYSVMIVSASCIGFLGFSVWAHHMFTVGMGPWANAVFSAGTMTIAIPTGVKVFNWLFTMWGGSIRMTSAWLYSVGFILMFTIGGITGVMHASPPIDFQQHDTYFVVGHFHYVLIGGSVMGLFAAIFYWFPKMFGRLLNETLGKWQFVFLFIGMNVTFMSFHFVGVEGMPRRYYYYQESDGWTFWNQVATIGAYIQASAFVIFLYNLIITFKKPKGAEADPWDSRTLEWSVASVPPEYNFYKIPQVEAVDDFWYKKQKYGAKQAIELPKGNEVVHLPSPSWLPFLSSLALGLLPIGVTCYAYTHSYSYLLISVVGFVAFLLLAIKWAFTPVE